jgi:hypothetical protein
VGDGNTFLCALPPGTDGIVGLGFFYMVLLLLFLCMLVCPGRIFLCFSGSVVALEKIVVEEPWWLGEGRCVYFGL